jgi:hypothetical protein
MSSSPKTAFVLGAGFTKAFLPNAPLLEDNYGGKSLDNEFRHLAYALRILKLELALSNAPKKSGDRLNLERLMTRLQGRMPYDFNTPGAIHELDLLLSRLKLRFIERLNAAKPLVSPQKEVLEGLASICLKKGIDCITFNYDDVFDEVLWNFNPNMASGGPRWSPNGGYGFLCKPSERCVRDISAVKWVSSMLLLKLHGSMNWRIMKGQAKPYGFDAIMHHEGWFSQPALAHGIGGAKIDLKVIEPYLEPEPFMVPPVLAKADLIEQPVLRLLWGLAYDVLCQAEEVTFVGYSLPLTDIAASTLFREALAHLAPPAIKVVDFAPNDDIKRERSEILLASYRKVFPGITETQLDFRGGLEWAKEVIHHG